MLNKTVLMSGAEYFSDQFAINPHMLHQPPVNIERAKQDLLNIRQALESAGIKVVEVDPPAGCQDGVYTANWALCRGNKALMSVLPNKRKAEMPYAAESLNKLGKEILKLPDEMRFSGQGDALPCGNYVFVGSNYRTDLATHSFINKLLGFEVIALQTVPKRHLWGYGPRIVNKVTGWPDSYYYDIDLALAVIKPDLIAYCPDAFIPQSREVLAKLPLNKILVSRKEASKGFACNLISNGETVIMSPFAPQLKIDLERHGLKIITPEVMELQKGGGFIRCTSLTLDNA